MQNNLVPNLKKRVTITWLVLFFSLAILLFLIPLEIVFSWQIVISFFIVMAGLNLLFSWFIKKNKFIKLSLWLWPVSEIWLITLIIYYTGGFASVFSFLYLIPITTSAILFSLQAGLGIAIFSSFTYLGLTVLELYGVIPHVSKIGAEILTWPNSLYIAFSVILNRILIFFVVAYLGGFLSSRQKEMDKLKTEFISIASHQLRTPTTSIRLFVEMLRNETTDILSDKHREYLDNIHHSAGEIFQLVDDFLDISRIESGKLEVKPKLVQLEDIIRSVINDTASLAEFKKCRVIFQTPKEKFSPVLVDKNLIKQVINNLIVNAIRYSPGDKKCNAFIFLTEKNDREYLITIKDNGIGIPEEAQKNIFSKFFRADNAVKLETEGAGLGLYIARVIIEIIGGKIWFDSIKGQGSVFYITIPKK
ncbi:HAMP domain-containing histidine kinase [Patescibacteria group bacterium]|nr:HAMP domain-containing histidine kinase [Patescibacteria group bacterium]